MPEVVDHGAAVLRDVDILALGIISEVEDVDGKRVDLLVIPAALRVVHLPMPCLAWDTTIHGRPVQKRPKQTTLTTRITHITPDVRDEGVTPTTHPHVGTVHE